MVVGTPRAIASLMRADGATHRIAMGPRSRPRAVHLYERPSSRVPGAFATCAVVQLEPGVWRAEGWITDAIRTSRVRLIPLGAAS